jgi:hypothetical protein
MRGPKKKGGKKCHRPDGTGMDAHRIPSIQAKTYERGLKKRRKTK